MWCNTQVSYSPSTNNRRSESELETDPRDPFRVVGASKRFNNILTYDFTLAAYASTDGGESWIEAPPLALLGDPDPNKRWAGITDPVLAWDDVGGCYLVALAFPGPSSPFITLGIAVYKSIDGGRTWSAPNFIHPNTTGVDDKQWAASDRNPGSRNYGNVYLAWDNGSQLAFARTTDRGAPWTGVGNKPVGEPLAFDSFSPSIAVTDDGSVNIFWIAGSTIKFVKSTNAGKSFSNPQVVASGLTTLTAGFRWWWFPEVSRRTVSRPDYSDCLRGGGTDVVGRLGGLSRRHLAHLLPPIRRWRQHVARSNIGSGTAAGIPGVWTRPARLSSAVGKPAWRRNRMCVL